MFEFGGGNSTLSFFVIFDMKAFFTYIHRCLQTPLLGNKHWKAADYILMAIFIGYQLVL